MSETSGIKLGSMGGESREWHEENHRHYMASVRVIYSQHRNELNLNRLNDHQLAWLKGEDVNLSVREQVDMINDIVGQDVSRVMKSLFEKRQQAKKDSLDEVVYRG